MEVGHAAGRGQAGRGRCGSGRLDGRGLHRITAGRVLRPRETHGKNGDPPADRGRMAIGAQA